MKAAVLAYGLEEKQVRVVKTVCARQGLRLRRVTEEELGQPVGAFFGLAPYQKDPPAGGEAPGPMLVMGGLTGPQLDVFLSGLKTARAAPCLKAVLTEQNARWDGARLYAALREEHQAMADNPSV